MKTDSINSVMLSRPSAAGSAFRRNSGMRRIWISFTAGWLMAGATGHARPLFTGPDAGAGPQVNRFEGGSLTASFFAYAAGVTSGVRVAAGDVDGDGTAD